MAKNLSIGRQIGLGFGLVLIILVLTASFAISGLLTASENFRAYRELALASLLSGRVQPIC